jgi:myo-inositol-1(or 4)-monophosphatase
MGPAWDAELAFAEEIARAAGNVVRDGYGQPGNVRLKSARDVVTDVDVRAETSLVTAIRDRFPDDSILTEEAGLVGAAGAARLWVLDPLDGTVNYASAIPYFSVSVALVVDGRPAVGVVYDPLRDDLYAASAGGPARLNGREVRVSPKERLIDCVVSLTILGAGGLERERAITPAIRIHRRMGSAALSLASVGAGRFDAFVQNGGLSRWDVAAAGLIAERGGALVTDLSGGEWWDPDQPSSMLNVVAASPPIHATLLGLLATVQTTVQTRP